jgi:SnoaL-like domain
MIPDPSSRAHPGIAQWHAYMASGGDAAVLSALLADDVTFHSPVVHTPQMGKPVVMTYLLAAARVLGNETFRYVRELIDGDQAVLEFVTELDGITVNGVDIIRFDADGRIADFKVMVRPLKAINMVWQMMGAQLQPDRG